MVGDEKGVSVEHEVEGVVALLVEWRAGPGLRTTPELSWEARRYTANSKRN